MSESLELVPVGFRVATEFVRRVHRHHPAPVGHKFSIGVADDGALRGVVIVGRPVARHLDDGLTLEVTRTATDGARNACSMLLAAAWRATKAMGFKRLVTYTQANEPGTSLRAAGWRVVHEIPARRGWDTPSRPRNNVSYLPVSRTLWEAGGGDDG